MLKTSNFFKKILIELVWQIFLQIYSNYLADWALLYLSTAPEVAKGDLDQVGQQHFNPMLIKDAKTE